MDSLTVAGILETEVVDEVVRVVFALVVAAAAVVVVVLGTTYWGDEEKGTRVGKVLEKG